MKTALETLLEGAVDYAGTFPPARLPLEQSAAAYVEYRSSPESGLLGRFVCAAGQLPQLPAGFAAAVARGGRISAVVDAADTVEQLVAHVDAALDVLAAAPFGRAVDGLEMRWPDEVFSQPDSGVLANTLQLIAGYAADSRLGRAPLYFELPPPAGSLDAWNEVLDRAATATADYNRTAGPNGCRAGLKFRTGGLTPTSIPSSEQLADVIIACRDREQFWKATAGLHHPLRRFDPELGAKTHGFLNLFVAAALADAHGLSAPQVRAILDDESQDHFSVTSTELAWRGYSIGVDPIAAARRRGLRSFGSCSFTEPAEGLHVLLHAVPAGRPS